VKTAGIEALLPGFGIGLALAILLVLAWLAGRRSGRRGVPNRVREVEIALRGMIRGHYDVPLDNDDDVREDGYSSLAQATVELARSLRDRHQRVERRALILGEAQDELFDCGLLVLDEDFAVLGISEPLAEMLGGGPHEFEGDAARDLFSEESWSALSLHLTHRDERRQGFRLDVAIRNRSGELVEGTLKVASSHAIPGATVAVFDRSLGTKAEELLLRQSLERCRTLLDELSEAYLVVVDGVITEANPASCKLLGADPAGGRFEDLLPAEDWLRALDYVRRAESGEEIASFHCEVGRLGDGSMPTPVEISAVPIVLAEGRAALLTLHPVRSAKRRIMAVPERSASLDAAMQCLGDGVVLLTEMRDGSSKGEVRVALVTRRLAEVLGLEALPKEGIPESAFRAEIAHRFADPADFVVFLDRSAEEPVSIRMQLFRLSGENGGDIEVISSPVRSESGKARSRLLIFRDVSNHLEAQRQLERDAADLDRSRASLQRAYEELAEVHRDLEQKHHDVEALNQELKELDKARSDLLGDLSHDLQTPLVSIKGYTQMILEGRLGTINEEQRRGLTKALQNVERMSEKVGAILALARAENAVLTAPEMVPLNDVVRAVVDDYQSAAREKRIHLVIDPESVPMEIWAERDGILNVLDNLVGNAVKFNFEGGTVKISQRRLSDGRALIVVADNGPGIPEEEREKIFERFYRASTGLRRPGSGIGLAMVRAIVERHGAEIEVEAGEEGGAVFMLRWPTASPNATALRTTG